MTIQSINYQPNQPPFKARIRLKGIDTIIEDIADDPITPSLLSSSSGCGPGSCLSTAQSTPESAAISSYASSALSSLNALGSEHALATIQSAGEFSNATPATMAFAQAHPSTMSTIMGYLGHVFNKLSDTGIKDPS